MAKINGNSMIEVHKQSLKSHIPIYHNFLQKFRKNEKEVYGFVEGNDDPNFYKNMILAILPEDWNVVLFPSKNRDNVINLESEISLKHYPINRICYFIDRDLSDFLSDKIPCKSNIFITKDYSIENYIVNFQTFLRIVEEIFNYTDMTVEQKSKLESKFNDKLFKFSEIMSWWMAQILIWLRDEKKLNLSNLKLEKIFSFQRGELCFRTGITGEYEYVKILAEELKIDCNDLEAIKIARAELLKDNEVNKIIRGKFLLWFLVAYLMCFKENPETIASDISKQNKINQEIGHKNAIVNIAPRSRTPQVLKDFIENNYITYIKSIKLG